MQLMTPPKSKNVLAGSRVGLQASAVRCRASIIRRRHRHNAQTDTINPFQILLKCDAIDNALPMGLGIKWRVLK